MEKEKRDICEIRNAPSCTGATSLRVYIYIVDGTDHVTSMVNKNYTCSVHADASSKETCLGKVIGTLFSHQTMGVTLNYIFGWGLPVNIKEAEPQSCWPPPIFNAPQNHRFSIRPLHLGFSMGGPFHFARWGPILS